MTDIIAAKDEYLEDRLKKAAEILWLVVEATEPGASMPPIADMTDGFRAFEIESLRAVLANGGPRWTDGRNEFWRWRALQILNIPRTLASSSAARERTERFA